MYIGINIMSSSVSAQGVTDYNYNISNEEVIFSFFFEVTPFLSALKDPQKWKIKIFGRAMIFLFSWFWIKHIAF